MRDLPETMPLSRFAKELGMSVDTAKRWLKSKPMHCSYETTAGGHWRVVLPHGKASLDIAKLDRALHRLISRKRRLRQNFALGLWGAPQEETLPHKKGGGNVATLPREKDTRDLWPVHDVAALIRQSCAETGADVEKVCGLTVPDLQLIAFHTLVQAASRTMRGGNRLTVKNLARTLHVSEATLYRKPFGKDLMKAACKTVEGAGMDSFAPVTAGRGNDLKVRQGAKKRPYCERREAAARRRIAKARHWLYWSYNMYRPECCIMRLYLVPEREVLRRMQDKLPRRIQVPAYTPEEMAGTLDWLSKRQGAFLTGRICIGSIHERPESVEWTSQYGGSFGGTAANWQAAEKRVLEKLHTRVTRKRIVLVNPKSGGEFVVPGGRH